MPEKYTNFLQGSSVLLALFASMGGCLVRYFDEYKHTGRLNLRWLFADLIISGFIGYFVFWTLAESTPLTLSQIAVATCIAGNLGGRVFDIVRFLISKHLGVPKAVHENYSQKDDKCE